MPFERIPIKKTRATHPPKGLKPAKSLVDFVAVNNPNPVFSGYSETETENIIAYLKEIKAWLTATRNITRDGVSLEDAFQAIVFLGPLAKEYAWVEMATTVKAHNYFSIPAAEKMLTPSLWSELIDETMARLDAAERDSVRWWE